MAASSFGSRGRCGWVSFFVRPRRFFVPTSGVVERRAQPRSRLGVAARVPQDPLLPGHALTAASTARGLRVGALGRDMGGET